MAIEFACECGKRFSVRDELAGKSARCPGCGRSVVIPPSRETALALVFPDVAEAPEIGIVPDAAAAAPLPGRLAPRAPIGVSGAPCPRCGAAPVAGRKSCGACGWDSRASQRLCVECEWPVIVESPFGVMGGVKFGGIFAVLVTGALVFCVGVLGASAIGAGLIAVALAVQASLLAHRCTNCHRIADPRILDEEERAGLHGLRRKTFFGAAGAGGTSAVLFMIWIALLVTLYGGGGGTRYEPPEKETASREREIETAGPAEAPVEELIEKQVEAPAAEPGHAGRGEEAAPKPAGPEDWVEALASQGKQAAARDALLASGQAALPALREGVAHKDRRVRRASAELLLEIGGEAEEALALPVYREALADRDKTVRRWAIEVVARRGGEDGDRAIAALGEFFRWSDHADARWAARTLALVAEEEPEAAAVPLVLAYRYQDPETASVAEAALRRMGKPAAPALAAVLEEDPTWVARIGPLLDEIDPGAKVPALRRALGGERFESRLAALQALGAIDPAAPGFAEAVAALVTLLAPLERDAFWGPKELRRKAIEALGRMGPAAEPACEALASIVASGDADSSDALGALVKIGPGALPHLADALGRAKDPSNSMRVRIVESMGRLGAPAEALVAALEEYLHDDVWHVRSAVLRLLGEAGPAAYPAFERALGDGSQEVRMQAVNRICELGPEARKALAASLVRAAVEDEHEPVRNLASRSLADLGPVEVDRLGKYLRNSNEEIRVRAMELLGRAATENEVDVLIEALDDRSPGVQRLAIGAVARVGPAAKKAVPALIRLLRQENMKYDAAEALGAIGPEARSALPALRQAAEHDSLPYRFQEPIRKIEGK